MAIAIMLLLLLLHLMRIRAAGRNGDAASPPRSSTDWSRFSKLSDWSEEVQDFHAARQRAEFIWLAASVFEFARPRRDQIGRRVEPNQMQAAEELGLALLDDDYEFALVVDELA